MGRLVYWGDVAPFSHPRPIRGHPDAGDPALREPILPGVSLAGGLSVTREPLLPPVKSQDATRYVLTELCVVSFHRLVEQTSLPDSFIPLLSMPVFAGHLFWQRR